MATKPTPAELRAMTPQQRAAAARAYMGSGSPRAPTTPTRPKAPATPKTPPSGISAAPTTSKRPRVNPRRSKGIQTPAPSPSTAETFTRDTPTGPELGPEKKVPMPPKKPSRSTAPSTPPRRTPPTPPRSKSPGRASRGRGNATSEAATRKKSANKKAAKLRRSKAWLKRYGGGPERGGPDG